MRLGSRVNLEPPRFVPVERTTRTFALAEGTAHIAGVPMDHVHFRVDGEGVLTSITLRSWSEETARMQELRDLGALVCEGLGTSVDQYTPSPLGTPEPGEDWDPVITENEECSGESGGIQLSVSSARNSASDFANHTLTITLRPSPSDG